MISASAINSLAGIRHGFFTRNGGVSDGVYDSLNCGFGSGDSEANVVENRARAMKMLEQPADALVTVRQVHSAKAVIVESGWTPDQAPEADAMATRQKGIVLGILTADCVPVLLADSKARVIGAAHAGWRGVKAGVIEAAIDAMVELGAKKERIVAATGPCIRQGSYEVGPDFHAEFLQESAGNESFFAPSRNDGRYLFDLPTYAFRRLTAQGITDVHILQIDNLRQPDRFFSHRRSVLLGEAGCGRNLSAIVIGS
jgi:purine-nucleoside/S-methyl-5'-thioadenosine phosphorylase / adenosine deaminase